MKIFYWKNIHTNLHVPFIFSASALTIGGFDGPHRGHLFLLKNIISYAQKNNILSGVITFISPPRIEKNLTSLPYAAQVSTLPMRLKKFKHIGIDFIILIDFSTKFAKMNGTEFLKILIETVQMQHLVVGEDFVCGHRQDTGIKELQTLSRTLGFSFDSISKQYLQETGTIISSTAIRKAVSEGKFSLAENLLGYPFLLDFSKLTGETIGKSSLRFSQKSIQQVLPPLGEYTVRIYKHLPDVQNIINTHTIPAKMNIDADFIYLHPLSKQTIQHCVAIEFMQ